MSKTINDTISFILHFCFSFILILLFSGLYFHFVLCILAFPLFLCSILILIFSYFYYYYQENFILHLVLHSHSA